MDTRYNLNERYTYHNAVNKFNNINFDWEKEGVLRKCLPKILFKGNSLLVSFLQLIDMRIIILLQTVTYLKHFKHITWNS